MPRVKIEEGHEEVESHGRAGADYEIGKDVVAKVERGRRIFQLGNYDVDGCEDCVGHDDGIHNQASHEHFFGSGK